MGRAAGVQDSWETSMPLYTSIETCLKREWGARKKGECKGSGLGWTGEPRGGEVAGTSSNLKRLSPQFCEWLEFHAVEVGTRGAPGIHEKGQQVARVLQESLVFSNWVSTKGCWFLKILFLFSWHWYGLERRDKWARTACQGAWSAMCVPADTDGDGGNSSSDWTAVVAPWLWFPGEIVCAMLCFTSNSCSSQALFGKLHCIKKRLRY